MGEDEKPEVLSKFDLICQKIIIVCMAAALFICMYFVIVDPAPEIRSGYIGMVYERKVDGVHGLYWARVMDDWDGNMKAVILKKVVQLGTVIYYKCLQDDENCIEVAKLPE